jgi:threonine dehydrogenase-like Zn-dependent dehydrogenase
MMKAVAVFPGPKEVRLIDQAEPQLVAPDQARLRVLEVGVCGTDREICSFQYGTPPPGEDHLVIGHESLAEVVEVGRGVERLRPGDLVVATVRRPCLHPDCLPCRSGHQDYCATGHFTERGIKEAHGYMTELVVEYERYLNAVPPALREVAVLTEPLTIAEKAVAQVLWQMQHRPPWIDRDAPADQMGQGQTALVLGVGPVGLLGAMRLASAGFATFVYSRELPSDPRAEVVAAIGATYLSSQTMEVSRLSSEIGNIDLVYEAVGHSRFALEVLRILGVNGIYVMTGVPSVQAFVQAEPGRLMRDMVLKNQVLLGTVNAGPEAFASAVRNIGMLDERWPAALRSLISGRHPPEEAAQLVLGRPAGIKTLISFAENPP